MGERWSKKGARDDCGGKRHRRRQRLRAVAALTYLPSTFAFEGFERAVPFDYSRTANPTRTMLSDTLPSWKAERCGGHRRPRRD
jgi:cystathionine beta-lyase/cystathionine gamma-synthase